MGDVTRILSAIESGDRHAADRLLPLVYDELRQLAAARLARESPGQTLDATALVHEAYLRLIGGETEPEWDHRGHFFAAAAEAMRRILIDSARRHKSAKRGEKHCLSGAPTLDKSPMRPGIPICCWMSTPVSCGSITKTPRRLSW
jgi:RNA polymerase sigma factor (TIGR02999 family)